MTGTRRVGGIRLADVTENLNRRRVPFERDREEKARALSVRSGVTVSSPEYPSWSARRLPLCNLCATPSGKTGDDGGRAVRENRLFKPFSLPLRPLGVASQA